MLTILLFISSYVIPSCHAGNATIVVNGGAGNVDVVPVWLANILEHLTLDKAERQVERAEDKAERAAERAADKAERQAERAADKTERQAERAADKAERQEERAADKAERQVERAADKAERKLELAFLNRTLNQVAEAVVVKDVSERVDACARFMGLPHRRLSHGAHHCEERFT